MFVLILEEVVCIIVISCDTVIQQLISYKYTLERFFTFIILIVVSATLCPFTIENSKSQYILIGYPKIILSEWGKMTHFFFYFVADHNCVTYFNTLPLFQKEIQNMMLLSLSKITVQAIKYFMIIYTCGYRQLERTCSHVYYQYLDNLSFLL